MRSTTRARLALCRAVSACNGAASFGVLMDWLVRRIPPKKLTLTLPGDRREIVFLSDEARPLDLNDPQTRESLRRLGYALPDLDVSGSLPPAQAPAGR